MNKLEKIILHVGGDKTGSTTIQDLFHHNRELLAKHGYCYPPELHHAFLAAHFSDEPSNLDHFRERLSRYEGVDVNARAEAYAQELESDLGDGCYHTLVLSYEGILGLNSAELGEMKRFLSRFSSNIEVIYYLRPHLSYATSAMSQRVRFGSPAWSQHPPVTHYMPRLKILESVFGRQALRLKRFAKSDLKQGDIAVDFLAELEMPEELLSLLDRRSEVTNSSLSEAGLFIGDAMTRLLASASASTSGLRGVDFSDLFCELLERIEGRRYQLNQLQLDVIRRATLSDSELVLSQYGIDLGAGMNALEGNQDHWVEQEEPALAEATAYSLARILIQQVLPDFTLPETVPLNAGKLSVVGKASGSVTLTNSPVHVEKTRYRASVLIENKSSHWWGRDVAPVCVSYHWLDTAGEVVEFEGLRSALPAEGIESGHSAVVEVEFCLPEADGDYLLEITLVQEFYNWFECIGLNSYRLPVRVEGNSLALKSDQ